MVYVGIALTCSDVGRSIALRSGKVESSVGEKPW